MPSWLREILISLGIAARTIFVFAVAAAFGISISLKVADGNFWGGRGCCRGPSTRHCSALSPVVGDEVTKTK